MKLSFIRSQRVAGGFSLVEVALAVAIAALGIITCLGLIPEGLEMSRKTSTLAINSNILEQIIRDIENASGWKSIKTNFEPPTGHPAAGAPAAAADLIKTYDYQGTPLLVDDKNISYVAKVSNDRLCFLPGAAADQQYLARLVIRIASTSNPEFDFEKAPVGSFATFHHLVAKSR